MAVDDPAASLVASLVLPLVLAMVVVDKLPDSVVSDSNTSESGSVVVSSSVCKVVVIAELGVVAGDVVIDEVVVVVIICVVEFGDTVVVFESFVCGELVEVVVTDVEFVGCSRRRFVVD